MMNKESLTMDKYQEMAMETAIYPEEYKVIYPALGITGEAGEVSDKIKKLIRDKNYKGGEIEDPKDREDIAYELGDVLWYVVTSANDIGYSLEQIALMNYDKLSKRKEQGKISGSGDHRESEEFKEFVGIMNDAIEKGKEEKQPTLLETIIMMLGMIVLIFALLWILK